jgi:hypothetical protein
MLTFFLIVCTHVNSGVQCLPPIQTKSSAACDFMARHYRAAASAANSGYTDENNSSIRCITVK